MFCKNCGNPTPSETAFCGKCGAPVIPNHAPQEQSAQKKAKTQRRNRLLLVAGVAIAAVVIALIVILLSQPPKFELLSDGSLYCSRPDEIIRIPSKFDGKADSLAGNYDYCNFKYDGKLRHFLKFYGWIAGYNYRGNGRYIYCDDYTLYIAPNGGNGIEVVCPSDSGAQLITVNFSVLNGDEVICSFETYSELHEWLN